MHGIVVRLCMQGRDHWIGRAAKKEEVVLEESRYVHACMVHPCRKMAVQCHAVTHGHEKNWAEMLIEESPICEALSSQLRRFLFEHMTWWFPGTMDSTNICESSVEHSVYTNKWCWILIEGGAWSGKVAILRNRDGTHHQLILYRLMLQECQDIVAF